MSTQMDVQSDRAYSEQYHEVLEQLYDKIERSAKADVVFATPQKHEGLTIIPVASVGWRFGSGTGTNRRGIGVMVAEERIRLLPRGLRPRAFCDARINPTRHARIDQPL